MSWNDYALAAYEGERLEPPERTPERVCAECHEAFLEGDKAYQWDHGKADLCEWCFRSHVEALSMPELAGMIGLKAEAAR